MISNNILNDDMFTIYVYALYYIYFPKIEQITHCINEQFQNKILEPEYESKIN